MRLRWIAAGVGGLCFVGACGGKAVIDGDAGTGGQAASTNSTTVSTTITSTNSTSGVGGSGGGNSCADLTSTYLAALERAMECDTCDPIPEACETTANNTLTDECGCPAPVNFNQPNAVAEASEAFEIWVEAGCGPKACGTPCEISQNPICAPTNGCAGRCVN